MNTFERTSVARERVDEPITGLDQLLALAATHSLQTPDRDTLSKLLESGEILQQDWNNHPITKILLLALRVMKAEQQKTATNRCDDPRKLELEVRAPLIKAETIDKLIRYVQDKPFVNAPCPFIS